MIVFRLTNTVKRGRMEEAIALQKEGSSQTTRIYRGLVGPDLRNIVVEREFESMSAIEQWDADVMASPEWEQWQARWWDVIEGPGVVEYYMLE